MPWPVWCRSGFLCSFIFIRWRAFFLKSFFQKGHINLAFVDQVLGSKRMLSIIWFTFWQAGLSTFFTFLAALPCAYVFAHYSFRGKQLLKTMASIPFVLPAVVVASAFQACFGRHSALLGVHIDNPLAMVLLAHVFYNFSIMLRIVSGFWSALQGRIQEAAVVLGAGPVQLFFYVVLPLLKPAIVAASALVFIFCFSSFGIILILGGPAMSTIEVEIYRQAAHLFNLPVASLLSLIQIGFTFVLMGLYTSFSKRAARFSPDSETARLKKPGTLLERTMVGMTVSFIGVFCLMPLLILAAQSLIHEGHWSLIFYKALFVNLTESIFYVSPLHAIKYSIVFAVMALLLSLLTGFCAAIFIRFCDQHLGRGWAAFWDPLFMLPLSTSAVTLGFGIIITLGQTPVKLENVTFSGSHCPRTGRFSLCCPGHIACAAINPGSAGRCCSHAGGIPG
jgi:thiamine transport system permease protein